MRNALVKPQAEQDSQGRNIITKRFLKKLCEYDELFETPHLNKHLYLHYMSFVDIRNLDEFTNLRVLWLENNMIGKIENLDNLTQLRCLYLQYNCISKIENLHCLTSLTTLNLSHNSISVIENLADLIALEDFNISHNNLVESARIAGLIEAPTIKILDLRENSMQDSDLLLETLTALKQLKCLNLKGNRCVHDIRFYRKLFLGQLKEVVFMDDKNVSELERIVADAWAGGGEEAERAAKAKFYEERDKLSLKTENEAEEMEKFREKKKKAQDLRDLNRNAIAEEKRKIMNSQFRKVELVLKEKAKKGGKNPEIFEKYRILTREKIAFEKLEELLILNQFDFEKVWNELKDYYDCSIDSLIDQWEKYN